MTSKKKAHSHAARRREAAYRVGFLAGQMSTSVDPVEIARTIILHIADVASAVGYQSGEPAMEIAGQVVSVLRIRPELIPRFAKDGAGLFIDGSFAIENGCLPYRARNGEIISPSDVRREKGIQQ